MSRALGASALAIGATLATSAAAQCTPDPTQANGTTTCSGTDPDGIRVTTSGTTMNVLAGAAVNANARAAIGVDVPTPSYNYTFDTVNVSGRVTGTGQPGVALNTTTGSASLTLNVAAGGSVTGSNAVLLTQGSNNAYGSALVNLDNSGALKGSNGVALLANGGGLGFQSITNRASGAISGISGAIGTLNNAGTIDGGTASAIDAPNSYNVYGYGWTNTGTIRSASDAATVQIAAGVYLPSFTNGGAITNTGSGAAISGGQLMLTNQAGGIIGSAGTTAIVATAGLTLVNLGKITGDVVASAPSGSYFTSTVDSSNGTVTGSLRFGGGDDTLVARYTGSRTLATGFSGTVDGGGGVNTEQVAFVANTVVAGPIDLATNFQRLGLAPATGVTVILDNGFVAPGTLVVSGGGSIINRAAISTAGSAIVGNANQSTGLSSFSNEGSIRTTVSSGTFGYALDLSRVNVFTNSGTLDLAGAGVSSSGTVTNTGSITATGTAVNMFNGRLVNAGTIRSTGGIGVTLNGNVGVTATNSGTITGATIGAETSVYLTNSGTILASQSGGTAVQVDAYGALINTATGVVGNGGRAVVATLFNTTVANAGVINGSVAFTFNNSYSNNRYIAQTGGVLNGDLTLGTGDLLVTDLAGTGGGKFAGINGTVSAASDAVLRLRATGTQSATPGPVGPFTLVGYELNNGAALTLTAPATVTRTVSLAGTGTVTLNGDFAATSAPAIQSVAPTVLPGVPYTDAPVTALAITSNATITATRSNAASSSYGGAVSLGGKDSFTNAGTITVIDRNSFPYTYAITGGASVTNSGAIRLDGGYGVSGAAVFTNTGTITQVAGGATAQGVLNVATVNNSGTISVGGTAVQLSSYYPASTLTNSGTLASTGGVAVTNLFGGGGSVTNLAGGTIRGAQGVAVQTSGGTFSNAGAVTGTVDLGYTSYGRSFSSATYIADGGTIAGDLRFGSGSDVFLQTGATTGVSGVIDGGGGFSRNLYGRSFIASGTFALDAVPVVNFQDRLVQAIGADTVVTTTGTLAGDLYATGTGGVVNQASVSGRLLLGQVGYYYSGSGLLSQDTPASVVNVGTISGGVSGATPSFTNSGTIGSARLTTTAVSLSNNGPLSFTNTGQIAAAVNNYYGSAVRLGGTDTVAVMNSGTITGGLSAIAIFSPAQPGSLSVVNSGTLSSSGAYAPALSVAASAYTPDAGGAVTVSNSGTVTANSSTGSTRAWIVNLEGTAAPTGYTLVNSGTVSATASGSSPYASAFGLQLGGGAQVSGTIANLAGGSISATGARAYALVAYDTPLMLDNAGLISASGGTNPIAILTFSAFNNTVRNSGTIRGDVLLADGADRVENAGSITGNVLLGAGDDVFVQRGGTVSGVVDGGDGADLLQVDASDGGAVASAGFTNFERVRQVGTGNVAYSGAFGVGTIELAGGTLSVATGQRLSTTEATTITGTGGGVSIVNAGTIAGGITLGDGGDSVTNSGTIGGPVLLGGGADSFRMTSGATLGGIVDGGAGYDSLTLALATDTVLRPGVFQNFEALSAEGASALTLAGGAFGFDRVSAQGNLAVASDASLAATVAFGASDNRSQVAGGFTGSVDGGAGNDTIEVSAGTQAAPVAFGAIGNVEAYRQTAGFATLAGNGNVGAIYLGGGRFVGLAGSTLTASRIGVDTGATFGSAGVVNGDIAVAGTLSPGASPGTMTVNGNVSLLNGSVSLFELTPAVSDKLVVNGTVGIAAGATLQLAPAGYTAGGVIDLVTASGGVSGAFTTLSKPASLNGFLSYQATRIQFVTAFTGDAGFTPQAARSLAYTNGVLFSGQASAALLAGLPRLLTATGAASAAAFNRVTPEAYATAQQIGVESGLALSESARGFAAPTDRAGLFTFGELQGDWTRLPGNGATGASRAEASAQGLLGGVGVGTGAFSLGAFAGYRWTNQRIAALDARTRHDGTVAGVQARVAAGGFALLATGVYDGGDAVTTAAFPTAPRGRAMACTAGPAT